jgi:hypothetical protein
VDKIQCPNCGHRFELSETIFSDLEEDLRTKFEAESLSLKNSAAIEKKQLEERLVKEKEQFIKNIEEETSKRIKSDFDLKSNLLQEQLESMNTKYLESQEKIQKLLLETSYNQQGIEEERTKLLEEHNKNKKELEIKIQNKVDEEHRLKTLERDKIIQDQKNKLVEMQRRLEQGSQQTQGEVFELDIETKLQVKYPQDGIFPVAKGVRGADIIQSVRNNLLQECGKIIIEVKNTKQFSKKFIDKIKDDKREANADIAIILTVSLPSDVRYFTIQDGVIVCDYVSFFNLIDIFRNKLIEIHNVKVSNQNRANKVDILYSHVTDPKFFEKLTTLYDLYVNMKSSLDLEKNSIRRHWNKRETELEILVSNVNDIWSGLNAIVGTFSEE